MRKVATHVLPGREAKAKPAMPPPKAAPVMRAPGYTPGFTPVYGVPGVPQRMAPQMAFKYRTMEASAPKAPEKGPEINTPSAPSAASAANAPSANTASKGEDRPQKSERRGVTKRWEAVRERALTLLAAPSGSPRDGASPPQSAKRRKGRRTDGDAYRDRALTLLASSKSESMKEKTKTFIEKHQVDIPLNSEADEIQGDKQSEQQNDETLQKPLPESPEKLLPETCDQPEGVDGVASPEKCQSPEKEDLPAEMCGTPSEKGSMSLAKSSTPKKLGSTSPAKSNIPEEPPGDETQLAQVQASIFWILGCLFECLFFSVRLCFCCVKSTTLNEPKRRFGSATGPAPATTDGLVSDEPVRFPFGWSTTEPKKRFAGGASATAMPAAATPGTSAVPPRRAPPRGRGRRGSKAGKTPELYNELEKLEDFFRQEAVFMAKDGSGSN